MKKVTNTMRFAIATGALLLSAGGVKAGDATCLVIDDKCPEVCKEDPRWCEIFNKSTLYKNENNCLIQKVQITGRYHGQYQSTSIDHSDGRTFNADYWEHRRMRLGSKIQFLNDFTFESSLNLGEGSPAVPSNVAGEEFIPGDFIGDIDELFIEWEPKEAFIDGFFVRVGKQKQKITREFSASSKNILTFERSHIVNEVADTKPWGISTGFEFCNISHVFGAWMGGSENEADGFGPLWPSSEGRGGLSYNAAYKLTDNTCLYFDYAYSNNDNGRQDPGGNSDERALNPYNHVFALGTDSAWDLGRCDRKWGIVTDVIVGRDRLAQKGSGNAANNFLAGEDTFGFVFMPHIDLTDRLELVGKYAYASDSRFQRPERRDNRSPNINNIPRWNLSDVQTAYVGLNYRLCGDNLRLMGGYEHISADLHNNGTGAANLGSIDGGSWLLGVRTYW